MRTIYRANFRLGAPDESGPGLDDVVRRCMDWVFHGRGLELPQELNDDLTAAIDQRVIGPETTVETAVVEADAAKRWALRFEHPDRDEESLRWQTDLVVRAVRDPEEVYFTCIMSRGARTNVVVPMRPARSRPRIVQTLIDEFGGTAGLTLSSRPQTLSPSSVEEFVALLQDAARARPVVLVSARNVNDQPIVDGRELASWLCGLAHVFVADSRFPSLSLNDHLPERLRCWNGAVRIYWPGFRKSDDPFRHRLWPPQRIREIEQRGGNGFREHVLAYVADAASSAIGDAVDTWESVQAARRRQLMSELRQAGKTDELVELADETIRELEAKNRELEASLEVARSEARLSQDKAESWRKAYEDERKGRAQEPDEAELPPIESVSAAVARAQSEFAEQLILRLNSASDVESNPYEEPEEVWAALEWLGTTYYRSRIGELSVPDFDLSLREACGWRYEAHQSEVTMTKYKRWYTTTVDGQRYWLHEHMGTGSGKDARYTIRIGFDWDKDSQRVIIGYIGQHQQTGAT